MRKILLASTALVAMTSVSAMAADISISGSTNLTYLNDTAGSPTDESSFKVESDIAIKFSATTDSGITTTMTYGFDDTDAEADDANATISGDFGSLKIVNGEADDNYVEGLDENYDLAGEGSEEVTTFSGVTGDSIGYKLPTIVEGMMVAVQHSNEDGSESFGYGFSYDAGMATLNIAKMANNTEEYTTASLTTEISGISLAIEQNKKEVTEGTIDEDETTAYGAAYTMDGITLAYEAGSTKDEDGSSQGDYSQFAVKYAIAPGIAAIFTTSEVNDEDGSGADDVESTDLQLQLSF